MQWQSLVDTLFPTFQALTSSPGSPCVGAASLLQHRPDELWQQLVQTSSKVSSVAVPGLAVWLDYLVAAILALYL